MNNEKGISLVEALVGMVIISIILLSTAQIIIQSKKTAEINKNDLIVTHLADAMLERLKIENEIVKNAVPQSETWDNDIEIPLANEVRDYSEVKINNNTYFVSAFLTPMTDTHPFVQEKLNLVNVRIQVEDRTGRTCEIEGYVEI